MRYLLTFIIWVSGKAVKVKQCLKNAITFFTVSFDQDFASSKVGFASIFGMRFMVKAGEVV